MHLDVAGLIENIVGGVIASLLVSIIAYVFYQKFQRRLYTRRILRPEDKDFDQLIDLYEQLMPEEYRSSVTDIMNWLRDYLINRKNPQHILDEYWLVGKSNGLVVSFMNFQYYRDSRFAFISYLGVDKQAIRGNHIAYQTVLKAFQKEIKRELSNCRGIVYETDAIVATDDPAQRRRKRARNDLFKIYARQAGFVAYEILIDYISPKATIEAGQKIEATLFTLSYIPLKNLPQGNVIARYELLEILRFIYIQVYGDNYIYDSDAHPEYQDYLFALFNEYAQKLPSVIKLR